MIFVYSSASSIKVDEYLDLAQRTKMNTESRLPSQVEFSCLSFSDMQIVEEEAQSVISDNVPTLCVPEKNNNNGAFSVLVMFNYEPERISQNLAPPKRFYRTFWRSITRRIIERELCHMNSAIDDL